MLGKKKKIILVGGGGHCKVVIDAINKSGKFSIEGIIDNKLKVGEKVIGISVIGGDNKLSELYKGGITKAFIAVGSVGDCSVRKVIYEKLNDIGFNLVVIVHPQAIVAQDVTIGAGTLVAAGAVINPAATIGRNVIINTRASIDHDCEIGDFVHIAPGVTLSGTVKIGEDTHVGTGTSVIQDISIGKRCMVKVDTTVKRDVADDTVVGPGIVDQNDRNE